MWSYHIIWSQINSGAMRALLHNLQSSILLMNGVLQISIMGQFMKDNICNEEIFGTECYGSSLMQWWCLTHEAKFSPCIMNLAGAVHSKIMLAICEPKPTMHEIILHKDFLCINYFCCRSLFHVIVCCPKRIHIIHLYFWDRPQILESTCKISDTQTQ